MAETDKARKEILAVRMANILAEGWYPRALILANTNVSGSGEPHVFPSVGK